MAELNPILSVAVEQLASKELAVVFEDDALAILLCTVVDDGDRPFFTGFSVRILCCFVEVGGI
jgi:hypothetical protein